MYFPFPESNLVLSFDFQKSGTGFSLAHGVSSWLLDLG